MANPLRERGILDVWEYSSEKKKMKVQLQVGEKIKQEAEELTAWFKINAQSALEDFLEKSVMIRVIEKNAGERSKRFGNWPRE